jgi:hypothetical protein
VTGKVEVVKKSAFGGGNFGARMKLSAAVWIGGENRW